MHLSSEQQRELAHFPDALQALVRAELAAGNEIESFGHTHPAPPAGAYVKLAGPVRTRARADGDGLTFYQRNSSLWSGEFTDAERFYWVLESPLPPPEEPDMDAIRAKFDAAANGPRRDEQEREQADATTSATDSARVWSAPEMISSANAEFHTELAKGRTHIVYFCDVREPIDVQFALERTLRTLFSAQLDNEQLVARAAADVTGARYDYTLRFLSTSPKTNHYALHTNASWAGAKSEHLDYFMTSSASWIKSWTKELKRCDPPLTDGERDRSARYRALCEPVLHATTSPPSVEAVQQQIVDAMKRGARFANSHKEGGTTITWHDDHFHRSDYGEDPDAIVYASEAEFLSALRRFLESDISYTQVVRPVPEVTLWQLILRRMYSR